MNETTELAHYVLPHILLPVIEEFSSAASNQIEGTEVLDK